MTRYFHTNGETIDSIRRQARARSRASGIRLSAAQEAIARELGATDMGRLVSEAISIEENDIHLYREIDGLTHAYDLSDLSDNGDLAFDEDGRLQNVSVLWSVESYSHGPALLHQFVAGRPTNAESGSWAPLSPAAPMDRDRFETALYDLENGLARDFIRLASDAGFFTLRESPALLIGDTAGLLGMAIRDQGHHIREEIQLGALTKLETIVSRHGRRALFAYRTQNGDVAICNAARRMPDLRWRLLSEAAFEEIRREMSEARRLSGDPAWDDARIEAYLYDKVLANETGALSA